MNPRSVFIIPIFLLFFSIPLFYKLGASSLTSFDEAWYAAISKNIINSGNLLNLKFNNQPFVDHPPAGFWLIAISQKIFGIDEFGSRAASAVIGLATLALIFRIGQKLSSPSVGLASAITLLSSPWFLSRARSGNLDIFLTFFFLTSFYLAILASENKKYLLPLSLSLILLFLTKTLVPFTILPALVILFWNSPIIKTKSFLISSAVFLLSLTVWFISQLLYYPNYIFKYFTIGLPKIEKQTSIWQNILLVKTYLHEGIGAFFKPAVLSLPLIIFLKNIPHSKQLIGALTFIVFFLAPFALSSRSQIWHLIPVFPFLIIISLTLLKSVLQIFFSSRLAATIIITLALIICLPQISRNWYSFIDIPAYISDEAILSRAASGYLQELYIDDRFLPAAVFYSGKTVNDLPTPDFSQYFSKSNDILLITHRWRLESLNPPPDRYRLLASDRDKVLLLIFSQSSN